MRVLHVLTTDQRRGAETSAMTLLEQLSARGHECTAVALEGTGAGNRHQVQVLSGRGRTGVKTLLALRRAARGADVVLAHGSTTLTACALALTAPGSPPFVYANIGDPLFWAPDPLRRLRVRLLLGRAAKVAALSPISERVLRESFGVPAEDVTVITNGRDHSHFAPPSDGERRAARERLAPGGQRVVVGFVGALSPEKRVDVAVRTLAQLPEARLLIAGDGPLRGQLERLAQECAPGRVTFLGQLADVRTLLAAVDVLLLTSDSEGLPGVLVEAGLCGLPVVATAVGFVGDVVLPRRTGLLVPPDDPGAAAAAVLEAWQERATWGPAAREHCLQAFALERVAERWERLLSDAVVG